MADSDDSAAGDTTLDRFERFYHVPVLAALMVFMFWTRFQNYDTFRRDGGVWLQAVDSWYHWRTTNWTVENFPWTLPFDAWTGFPDGTTPGQFGTVFDQFVALVALVLGLGSPGESEVLMAAMVVVPALAALAVVPVYYIGAHLSTRFGGLVGAGVLALFTGQFFTRSTAGQFQHHAAEVLLMGVAVFAIIVALSVAERERPVFELVSRRDWAALRRPVIYSAAAGVALTLYIWTWPPGVVLVGVFGLYAVLQLSLDQVRGRSPDHIAFVGVVSMLVVAAGTAARIKEPGFSATGLDFFQPVFALLVAGGCLFMAGLARVWDSTDRSRRSYPVAVGASVLATLGVLAVVLPGVFDALVSNLSGRLVPFGHSESALTVAEVDPPDSFLTEFVREEFGWAFWLGLAALPVLAVQSVLNDERGRYLFVLVWAVTLVSMGATQVRFNYYLALGVAVLVAHLAGFVSAGLGSTSEEDVPISSGQVLQASLVALVLVAAFLPLLPPLADETPVAAGSETEPFENPDAPTPTAEVWDDSTAWLGENTPEVGEYGGADNADEVSFDGRLAYPAGGSFDYPEGAYGVLSWWDFGHLITAQAERIPHSNPFQQNARSSAAFLTAQSEDQAELYLDAIAAGETVTHEADEDDLREAAANDDSPGIEYVMVNDRMAADIFPAITEWTGPDYEAYLDEGERTTIDDQGQPGEDQTLLVPGDYDDTMIARLYLQDADGLEGYRLVHEAPRYSIVGFFNNQQLSQPFGALQGVADPTVEDVTEPVLGETTLQEFIDQAEQSREQDLVGLLGANDPHVVSRVKSFERVDGATLTGEVEAENATTVDVRLPVRTGTNRTFIYDQTAGVEDGSFEVTVPYPTDEDLSPEDGYASSSVEADDDYRVTVSDEDGETVAAADEVAVPEIEVQTGGAVPVELGDPAEPELSNLDIAGQGVNATITEGEDESVAVDVENVGDVTAEFFLNLELGDRGGFNFAPSGEIAPGETETVTFENETGDLGPGVYDVEVSAGDESVTGELTVEAENPAESAVADLDIDGQGVDATITEGADVSVNATVENVGERADSFTATLSVGDETVDTSTDVLGPGESEALSFEGVTDGLEPGTYEVSLATDDDEVTAELVVETTEAGGG